MKRSNLTFAILLPLPLLLFGSSLPSDGEGVKGDQPVQRPATVVNVRDHGAKGDGVTDDQGAIKAAFQAAPDGAHIHFPAGTYYFSSGLIIKDRRGLALTGDPKAVLKAAGGKSKFILSFEMCDDISVTGLGFDLNGVTHFGPGLAFQDAHRIRIHANHFFDSNFQPKMSGDRYAIAFRLSPQGNEDIWITENLIEHLQVEVDTARRVHVVNNRSIAPELACGFGSFTLMENSFVEDIEFIGNYVENPQAYGICVAADGKREGATLRRVLITNNTVMCKKRAPMLAGIMVGSRDGQAVKSAKWEGVTITNNQIWYAKGIYKRHEESGIRVQVINSGEQVGKVLISGNTIIDEAGIANWGIETRGLEDAMICNNAVYGGRGGILLSEGWSRVAAQGNRVSDVTGDAYCLKGSGGDNHFSSNFVFGKVGTPYAVSGLQPSDRVDQAQPPAAGAVGAKIAPAKLEVAAPNSTTQPEKSDVTTEMVRIAKATSLNESFDSLDGVSSSRSTGVEGLSLQLSTEPKHEGSGAAKLSWKSGSGTFNAGFVNITRSAPTDITGRSFEVWVMPLDENAGAWRVIFYDAAGQMVETQQLYVAKPSHWTCLKFTQGKQTDRGWFYRKGLGDPTKVVKVQFAGTTKEKAAQGTAAAVIWDDFKMVETPK